MNKIYKWFLIAMLSCAFFFHQADRALFGLLTVPIQNELKLTNDQIGWINTVLSWTLAAMTTIAGFCGDRFSRKWLITGSLIFWSLMTVCMGFVGNFQFFGLAISAYVCVMFFRSIATGGGESFYAPSAYALIAVHHKESRSLALSIHQAALYIGLMTSGALVAWILSGLEGSKWVSDHFGALGYWRPVFIIFGVLGLILGVLFIFFLKESAGAGKVADVESAAVEKAKPKSSPVEGIKAFFCNPSALCATAGFVAIVFVNNAYLFWAPKFAVEKFGAELGVGADAGADAVAAAVAAAGKGTMFWHHLFAFAAILAGGVITDKFVKRFPRFRLGFQITALILGAPMLAWIGFAGSFTTLLIAASAYGVFRGLFEVNTHASLFDVVPPAHRSTAVGLLNMIAFFFGGLSGVLIGKLSQQHGVRGFEISFMIMAGTYALAAALMAISFFFTFRRNRVVEESRI